MIKTLLLLLFFTTSILASELYIKVTKTSSVTTLKRIKSHLNSMHLRMIYKKGKTAYIVYSGPYSSQKSASSAMKKVQRSFPKAYIIKPKKNSTSSISNKNGFFVGVALGYSAISSNYSIATNSPAINRANENGLNYELGGGYRFDNGLSLSLSYMKADTSDLLFDNIISEFNYNFSNKSGVAPFIGLSLGYGALTWNIDPIDNQSSDSNNDSNSILFGTQMGFIYEGLKYISIYTSYQYLAMQHITTIEIDASNSNTIENQAIHSLKLGIVYNF